MPDEIWKVIPDTEQRYEVSSSGRIRATFTAVGRPRELASATDGELMKTYIGERGYPLVTLWINGKQFRPSVAACVLSAFIGPRPSPQHRASYLDGNQTNVTLSNLKWLTPKENKDLVKRLGKSKLRATRVVGKVTFYQCTKCLEWLPRRKFYALKGGKSRLGNNLTDCGLHSECRECNVERRREYRQMYGDQGAPSLVEQILPLLEALDGIKIPLDELASANVGARIAAARVKCHMTRVDLAHKAGIHPETMSMIELGRNTPRPRTVRKLIDALRAC